ncbi:integrating conjugative element protein%2C PFL_4693 family [Burkholderia pseudomallei]|uniref:TIGR03759 family integrating conjugative element protein n=1 Tax=Burkholderia pseudomallei TaxID=28450 RepID=UPI0005DF6C46|nr:TIGR03759 family integrating conjugative element protein [Burkholderia pseudomallei]TPB79283.1 TIGR03759 family integrating conjugative element protein [Burkholderia pseudomallei]CAK0039102.1 integrating conjugative element protein, PFL_4693 family [Burkholderia pseudomallei]CFB52731.1 integrating conjugative element protein%2C PFL_4693 family [Burkholderia pseudomallei]CFD93101.1 integrating conjugative element protein%2C PFL_4693 family [Burkholderia pseudomallei]CFK82795.1 integrating co
MTCVVSLRFAFIAACLMSVAGAAIAQTRIAVSSPATSIERASPIAASDEVRAHAWGLDATEWSRYQQLMQGPLGIYSPNIDPLTALGIEARSDAERQHYAELQVRAEAQRVQKELVYQHAYDAAWKRLFPDQVPVRSLTSPSRPDVSPAHTGRLAVFIKDDCPVCDARVRQLQASGTAFDIYMVGSRGDDARIRAWAQRVGIDPTRVRARTITLNHDAGRWLMLGGQGTLPAVLSDAGSP